MDWLRTNRYDANDTVVTDKPTATVVNQITRLARLRRRSQARML